MSIRIVTDSSCDLPPSICSENGIEVVPLSIRFGETEYVDRRDLTPTEFWAKVKESKVLPETAAPSPGAFEECFRNAATQGATGVVCVSLSSGLSATYQSAQLAAEAVKDTIDVRVIDSQTVTAALGLLTLAAARAAKAGQSLDEVASFVQQQAGHVRLFAALDTLENLRKGGRIGAAQAMLGSMLSVKPLITVTDGAVAEAGKQRTRGKSLDRLIELAKENGAANATKVAVMHGDAPDVEAFIDKVCEALGCARGDVILADVGAVVGTHTGRGAIGIAWEENSG